MKKLIVLVLVLITLISCRDGAYYNYEVIKACAFCEQHGGFVKMHKENGSSKIYVQCQDGTKSWVDPKPNN